MSHSAQFTFPKHSSQRASVRVVGSGLKHFFLRPKVFEQSWVQPYTAQKCALCINWSLFHRIFCHFFYRERTPCISVIVAQTSEKCDIEIWTVSCGQIFVLLVIVCALYQWIYKWKFWNSKASSISTNISCQNLV